MTDETAATETHAEAATPAAATPNVAAPATAAAPATEWFDLSAALPESRHYEGLTGQLFTTTGVERRQVRLGRSVDTSAISDVSSALAAVEKAGRGRVTFRYKA